MRHFYFISMQLASLLFLVGCGSSDFPTAKTIGRVVCEGKPVAGAEVYFEPISGGTATESALVGRQGFAFTQDDGTFEISTYNPGKGDGAVVGKHRVRVGRGEAKCECALNSEVDLMHVEIKAGEVNEFELVLKKATRQQKMREGMLNDDDDDD